MGPSFRSPSTFPRGDIELGAIHTYAWTVPTSIRIGSDLWVKVIQINTIFEDQSDTSFLSAIVVVNPCPGDFNGDGGVNGGDLGILLADWGTESSDLNGDGICNGGDLELLFEPLGTMPQPVINASRTGEAVRLAAIKAGGGA